MQMPCLVDYQLTTIIAQGLQWGQQSTVQYIHLTIRASPSKSDQNAQNTPLAECISRPQTQVTRRRIDIPGLTAAYCFPQTGGCLAFNQRIKHPPNPGAFAGARVDARLSSFRASILHLKVHSGRHCISPFLTTKQDD